MLNVDATAAKFRFGFGFIACNRATSNPALGTCDINTAALASVCGILRNRPTVHFEAELILTSLVGVVGRYSVVVFGPLTGWHALNKNAATFNSIISRNSATVHSEFSINGFTIQITSAAKYINAATNAGCPFGIALKAITVCGISGDRAAIHDKITIRYSNATAITAYYIRIGL